MVNTLSAEAVLCEKGFLAETVVGTSMYPLLKGNRDTVIVEKIIAPLRKYDVVLFRRDKQLVLHRIVKIKDGYYLIRGDNCVQSEKVYDDQIIGKMTFFCRKGKQYSANSKRYYLYLIIWVRFFMIRVIYKKSICLLKRILRRHNEKV